MLLWNLVQSKAWYSSSPNLIPFHKALNTHIDPSSNLSLDLLLLHLFRLENLRPALFLTPQFLIMRLRVNLQLLQIRIHHFLAAVGALPQHTEPISFISLDPPTVLYSVCRCLRIRAVLLLIPYLTAPLFLLGVYDI